jgi:TP901 family phage tail tape measure protein
MAQPEIAKAIVDLDGNLAGAELKKLEARAKELRQELSKLGKENDLGGFRQKEKELKLVNSQMKNLKQSTWDVEQVLKKLNGSSINDLTRAQRALNSEIKRMTTNTKEEIQAYNQKIEKLKQVNNQLEKVKRETHAASGAQESWFSKAAGGFNKYFTVVSAGIATFTGVVFSVKSLIEGNTELDDSLADVMKTTGLTKKEVRELHTEFKNLNTRTPRKELLLLAEEAGRLGIEGKKNIMDFVEVSNMIKVSLGDDLAGNAEEAIREVGKLTEIYRVGDQYGVDFKQSMMMVGSAINEVSANSSANAPYLIDLTKRLAGVSSQAGINVQDIIGYAAALDEMGQSSEVSSTTLNKIIVNMFKDVDTYAGLANIGVEEFANLLQTDANEALIKVLEGLNGNNAGLSTMANKLDGLGLDGSRSVQILAALASNIDLVRKNQSLANTSLEEGTSLTKEYQIKNNNMAGSLEKIGRALKSMFVNSGVNEALSSIVTKVAKWVEIPVSRTMEQQRISVNALAIELTDANTEEQRRKDIYEELKSISPKIVEGISLEALNIDQLRQNLALYNEEQIKKIALQKAGEKQGESQQELGEAIAVRLKKEEELRQILIRVQAQALKYDKERAETINTILFSNDNLLDKEKKIEEVLMEINRAKKMGNLIDVNIPGNAAAYLTDAMEKELVLQQANNKELAAYMEMYRSIMGTSTPVAASPTGPKTVIDGETATSGSASGSSSNNLDKLADQQSAFRMRIINESKSLIEQENIAYEERLKDAGLFGKRKEDLTGEFLQTYELLENQHNANINKIHDQAYSNDLLENQKNFDQQTMIRQAAHNNEMAALGNNEEAKKALEKKFQNEELQRQQQFLLALLAELKQTVDGGSLTGIDEKLLTDEQKEALRIRIEEVKLMLSELGVKFSELNGGGAEQAPVPGAEKKGNVDIFGMSSDDWKLLVENIMAGEVAIENVIGAVGALTNAWSTYYAIKNNLDQQDLSRYEIGINTKKDRLKQQLDKGIISQEAYNSRVARLDESLDAKRKAVALKAAKRERNIALMNAIVNTAAGVVKMLNNPFPLNIILAALVGIAGGLEIGKIVSTPLPQAASGKYDVIGAKDGKKYNAKLIDSPGTGLIESPAIIVGEKPEIIIDPATTRNLQLNYPEVIQAINAARVPQYATGFYPANATSSTVTRETIKERELPKEFYDMMKRLNDRLDKGIGAKLVADQDYMETHIKVSDDYTQLKNETSLQG